MNAMHQMKDPAAGVAPQLLPHLHLISKYRYPITNNPSLETIVNYLLEAPKIVRDLQPVQWQFIDAPADGTVLLVWQPLDYLGTNMASDGYIWGDPEQVAKSEVRGYILEMYLHRSGYRAQGEAVASHSRRRYRLTPAQPSQPGLPSPDPSLFIIHYSKASSRETLPAASIPVAPPVAQQVQQRRMIQSQGQIARKDFMLHDRSNWPQIPAPQALARAVAQASASHRRGPSIGANEVTLEEEEDVSRGDILDFMTPREISRMRYEQHHEWMEEILESPYNIFQIVPGDLGLGRKGELEQLTRDFFDAPVTALRETSGNADPAKVGRMEKGKADDFKKRATDKIASMQAELEKMRETHARRMERLQRTTMLNSAERKLRAAPSAADGRALSTGSLDDEDPDALDEIAKEVEATTGKKIERIATVNMIARGGLEERAIVNNRTMSMSSAGRPVMSPMKATASPSVPQASMQQAQVQNGMPVQQHPIGSAPPSIPQTSQSPPAELTPVPEDQIMQEGAAMTGDAMPADADDDQEQNGPELPGFDDIEMDVDMAGLNDQGGEEHSNGEGNEWVMVSEEDEQKADDSDRQIGSETTPAGDGKEIADDGAQQTVRPNQAEQPAPPNEFDVGGDFDNVDVDTAGDALANYEAGNDEELNLDNMDDSAFGDAFHQEDDQDIS